MRYRIQCLIFLLGALTWSSLTAQDYVIWSGGVSEEERAMAPDTGTRLVFFVSTGSFLSDIAVTVSDEGGNELVDMTVQGPWLILDLPPGVYMVQASRRNGDVQSQRIEVASGGTREFGFMFPDS